MSREGRATIKKLSLSLLAASVSLLAATSANAATYTYVGSWSVGDGPSWTANPPVYSAQDAAALIFGGTASQYAISTLGTDSTLINFQAHVDGWADSTYLFDGGATVSQSYKLDTGGSGYNSNPGFGTAYSAYISDHSGAGNPATRNFAFLISGAVPEPATWVMMIGGFGMVGFSLRRRRKQTVRVTYA